ncbi:hypothetical protein [Mycobacterium botniense]|jgi:hypothetical protein|uniref:ATPase n=1 Tax=Mycobacterium botniense TaxID=84962 RepID=A0A7I9Y2S7_9MYCO|nr:hypothetical protein [Mycobacterium botniense]GFG76376.1 hypothetical protein MBOT_37410 [Mycobacterium botniense]
MSAADRLNVNAAEQRHTRATVPPRLSPAVAAAPTEPVAIGRPRAPRANVRRTVDLSPAQHRALDLWQREAADRLGLARVTGQEVLAALVDQLLSDPKLSAQITRVIQARR